MPSEGNSWLDERRGIPEFLSTEHVTETGFSPGPLWAIAKIRYGAMRG
jgi:hypothetical protein